MDKKLYVDDIRDPYDATWDIARSFHEAIYALNRYSYSIVSLDHDLGSFYGSREMTGYDILEWLYARKQKGTKHVPNQIFVHSANIIGAEKMRLLVKAYDELLPDPVSEGGIVLL